MELMLFINLSLKNGKNNTLAIPSLKVATINGSTLASEFPIIPKENAHRIEVNRR